MTTISFARHQFSPAIIRHAVWLYLRFTLSFIDVEDLPYSCPLVATPLHRFKCLGVLAGARRRT
jgi:transposase-like protein